MLVTIAGNVRSMESTLYMQNCEQDSNKGRIANGVSTLCLFFFFLSYGVASSFTTLLPTTETLSWSHQTSSVLEQAV